MKWITIIIVLILAFGFVFFSRPQPETIIETVDKECPVCPDNEVCEPEIIVKEVLKEVIKEVIKEIPVEKIVYRDNIVYQDSLDLRLELAECKERGIDTFNLYYQRNNDLNFCQATTTALIPSYKNLLFEFEELIDLARELNRDYIFSSDLTLQLSELVEFASSSKAFIGEF